MVRHNEVQVSRRRRAYSEPLREGLVKLVEAGYPPAVLADDYNFGPSAQAIRQWVRELGVRPNRPGRPARGASRVTRRGGSVALGDAPSAPDITEESSTASITNVREDEASPTRTRRTRHRRRRGSTRRPRKQHVSSSTTPTSALDQILARMQSLEAEIATLRSGPVGGEVSSPKSKSELTPTNGSSAPEVVPEPMKTIGKRKPSRRDRTRVEAAATPSTKETTEESMVATPEQPSETSSQSHE